MGNYLISSKISSNTLTDKIRKFNENWDVSFFQDKFFNKTNSSYDQIVENERIYVKKFVKRNCKDFIYLDERLYNKNIQSSNFKVLSSQIGKMLNSKNRLMRKKLVSFY